MTAVTEITEHYVPRQEGGRVYYYRVGQGEPLVFIPGGNGRGFRLVTDKFAQHFTCYVLDLPGSDHSDIPRSWLSTRTWTVSDYTAAILEVLDSIGIEQSCFIGDHTGAMIVLNIAAHYPKRVKKMVLDSLAFWDLRRGAAVWESAFKLQHTDTTSYDVPVSPLLPPWEEAKRNEPDLALEAWKLRDELSRRDRRWHRVHQYANSHFDTEALGPMVEVPTLLIYGEREVLRRGEKRAHEAIRGSILKIIQDSPRKGVATGGSHQFKPEEFSKLALDFLL